MCQTAVTAVQWLRADLPVFGIYDDEDTLCVIQQGQL